MSTDNESSTFDFCTLEEILDDEPPKSWILENVIAHGENSSWFGPPGSLKSALLTDVAISVAAGRDWRGHKFSHAPDPANDSRGVIFFALERARLTRRRIAAHIVRDGLPRDLPIAVISETIDLLDPTCADKILRTVGKFEEATDSDIALIVIDTYSKAIAAGDEDKAQTQNIAAATIKRIQDGLFDGVHIAMIGHTGKNPNAGERGSNAKLGHVDLAVQISGDKVRTATVVKGNDQSEGPIASFAMEEVMVPTAWSDEPYTVAILAAATPAAEARPAASQALTTKHAQVLDALRRAITARGQDGAVHVDFWKEELSTAGLLNLKAKNPRSAFKKLRDGVTQHLIDEAGGFVRIKNEIPIPGNLPACPVYPSPVPTSPS